MARYNVPDFMISTKKGKILYMDVKSLLSGTPNELIEVRKPLIDKYNNQVSVRVPRDFALKEKMNKNTEVVFVFNPTDETIEEIKKSKLVMFIRRKKESGKKGAEAINIKGN